ncbi:hypothetical protein KDC22_26730 [Paenibacillus tritici]|uniref:hypothetical protein n=1 Tax=Paenibacillus tritici TaxID=1873425 RepID=UPI001BADCA26|nr:hypothetical protein [Paenibacillus tritici]QUL53903.1 hypothetical protein KDC22_26730 [Paenibacillus tritici]
MKKILIVTHWYYPRNVPRAFRAKELVDEFRDRGFLVDLVVGDYKQFIHHEDYKQNEFDKEDVSNSSSAKLSNNPMLSKLKDIFNYFLGDRFFITSGYFVYKSINVEKYDSIISIGLPFYINFITALKVKKIKNTKCISISDWSDPFFKSDDTKVAFYFKVLQKFACSSVNYITIPTETALYYFENYTDKNKIKVIPQGFNFENVKLEEYKKNKRITFAYAGIFYKEIRNPEKLLDALSKIDIDFVFVMYTMTHGAVYTDVLLPYKNILGDKLEINSLISREECITKLSGMDFLINLENSTSNQVPSKLIDYALTKRPILSIKQGEISIDNLISFFKGDYSTALKIPLENYDIKNVCQQFIELVEGNED